MVRDDGHNPPMMVWALLRSSWPRAFGLAKLDGSL